MVCQGCFLTLDDMDPRSQVLRLCLVCRTRLCWTCSKSHRTKPCWLVAVEEVKTHAYLKSSRIEKEETDGRGT